MMINVSMVASVLARAQASNKQLDGIGVYTKELLRQLQTHKDLAVETIAYQGDLTTQHAEQSHYGLTKLSFKASSALSYLTRLPTPGLDKLIKHQHLIHYPDHCIAYHRGIPSIASIMDVIPLSHPQYVSSGLRAFKSKAFKFLAAQANHVITISEFSAQQITQSLGFDREKITVTHLGVDPDFFSRRPKEQIAKVKRSHDVKNDYFIFIGTLQPRKNVHRLVQAYLALPVSVRQSVQLVIVGRAREDMQELKQMLSDSKHAQEIKWLKYIADEDVKCLLQGAKAMVYPSLYEGFGLPIVEAFASLTPVITSNATSMPEVAGDAAFYVDPESTDSIRDAMLKVIDEPSSAAKNVAQGLLRARQFTWQVTGEQTVAAYKKVLGLKM